MKLSATLYNLRQQPVISAVSIIDTALAIFLIMIVVMIQDVKVTNIAPEVHRDRTLYAMFLCVADEDGNTSSGSISQMAINELYTGLDHVEHVGIYDWDEEVEAAVQGRAPMICVCKAANADFLNIIKYDYVDGAPYSEAEVQSKQKVAIITEKVARTLFDTTDVINREILINRFPYRIVGVIKDLNPITPTAYAEIIIPIPSLAEEMAENEDEKIEFQYLGSHQAIMLAEDAKYTSQIKAEVEARHATLNNKLSEYGVNIIYFGTPYTQEESSCEQFSNMATDFDGAKRKRIGLYVILLLFPAINLSSITQNRLRQRVSEIGLKRAFGCTRMRVMGEMFVENLLHTMVGAIIGLVLSILIAWIYGDFLFVDRWMFDIWNSEATFSPFTMMSWSTFGWALFFCLILNVLSCGIPVLIASRVNPAVAVNGHLK